MCTSMEVPGRTWEEEYECAQVWKYLEVPGRTWEQEYECAQVWKYLGEPWKAWEWGRAQSEEIGMGVLVARSLKEQPTKSEFGSDQKK